MNYRLEHFRTPSVSPSGEGIKSEQQFFKKKEQFKIMFVLPFEFTFDIKPQFGNKKSTGTGIGTGNANLSGTTGPLAGLLCGNPTYDGENLMPTSLSKFEAKDRWMISTIVKFLGPLDVFVEESGFKVAESSEANGKIKVEDFSQYVGGAGIHNFF